MKSLLVVLLAVLSAPVTQAFGQSCDRYDRYGRCIVVRPYVYEQYRYSPPVYVPQYRTPEIIDHNGTIYRGGQPSVRADLCYVRQSNEWVNGEQFFSLVSQWANRNNRCAIARINRVAESGRIYLSNGSRAAKSRGGLSHSETNRVLYEYGLLGCESFTCMETN